MLRGCSLCAWVLSVCVRALCVRACSLCVCVLSPLCGESIQTPFHRVWQWTKSPMRLSAGGHSLLHSRGILLGRAPSSGPRSSPLSGVGSRGPSSAVLSRRWPSTWTALAQRAPEVHCDEKDKFVKVAYGNAPAQLTRSAAVAETWSFFSFVHGNGLSLSRSEGCVLGELRVAGPPL